ncbi:MAG: DUF4878 domain-containing protein [Candidatus Cloacimonetes bacterium]|nr:DUF4878 domain-containing protein [Candidatus Cloacimonadota bacterium]
MKKLLLAITVIALLFALFGCAKGPESVVKKFLAAWENGNTDAMTKLSTPESKSIIGMASMVKIKDVKIGESKIEEDKANVKFSYTTEEGKTEEGDVNLVKKDGKWLVDLKVK